MPLTESLLIKIQNDIKERQRSPYPTHLVTGLWGMKYLEKCFPQYGDAFIRSITDKLQQVTLYGLKVCYGTNVEQDCFYLSYFIPTISIPFILRVIRISELEAPPKKEQVVQSGIKMGKTDAMRSLFERAYIEYDPKKDIESAIDWIVVDEANDITPQKKTKNSKRKKVKPETLHHSRLVRFDEE
jgi:hypothetical protein